VYNQKYFSGDFYGPAIRVADKFLCRCLRWYAEAKIMLNKEELELCKDSIW
jgi:hypothetical protein